MSAIRVRAANRCGRIATVALTVVALASLFAAGNGGVVQAAPDSPDTGNWTHQAPYPTRFAINGVDMVTPTEAWAVAYTDILHTTDGGATWEIQDRPGSENLYSVDFFDSQHGVAMGNVALYTTDGGDTWRQGTNAFGYGVEMANANLAFITDHRAAGFFRTTDGGANWTWRSMPSNISTIQCFDSLNCVAASPSGVYHSSDGGLNWSFVAGQGGEYESTYFVSHNVGWIIYGESASRTTDGGATWQPQTLPPGSWIYDFMFTDANNGWGVGDNMVRTTNGGATWQQVPLAPEMLPLWDVDFYDSQHGIAGGDSFLATESVLLTSTDGGANWVNRSHGSINEVLDMVALDREHAWASHVYGGKTSRTTDGGVTWQNTEIGDQYVMLTGIDMADLQHGWTVGFHNTFYYGYIFHTDDGGASWQEQYDFGADVLRSVAALDAQTAIIVGGDNFSGPIRHRTTDGGASWHELNVPITSYFFDVFFLDSNIGWMVGGNGDIVKSTDGGDTWVVQSNPAQYTLTNIHFSDADHGWAGGAYGTLVHTTNGGATWTLQNPQLPEYTHVLDVNSTSPLRGWIVGYGGGAQSRPFVKYTTDGGATWIEHTPVVGPYDSFGALAFLDDEYGWAAGAGGIFRHMGTGPQPTSTATPVRPTGTPVGPTATRTTQPAATATRTTQPGVTATGTTISTPGGATSTPATTHTPGAATATTTPESCNIAFSDVPPEHTFYSFVRCLACRQVLGGYSDGTFRPDSLVTRGQIAKIVSNAAGWDDVPGTQTFEDVPTDHTFYLYIERMASRGVINGYPCGGEGEPCGAENRPYFRAGNNATRGQISKIVSESRGYNDPVSGQAFEDVPPTQTFYLYIERLTMHSVMSGYVCGGPGEPCGAGNLPYFRPGNNATRGQLAKIVSNTFFPDCQAR